jgi:hypothetical protein
MRSQNSFGHGRELLLQIGHVGVVPWYLWRAMEKEWCPKYGMLVVPSSQLQFIQAEHESTQIVLLKDSIEKCSIDKSIQ